MYAKRESWVDCSSIQKVKPSSAVVERIFRVALLIGEALEDYNIFNITKENYYKSCYINYCMHNIKFRIARQLFTISLEQCG